MGRKIGRKIGNVGRKKEKGSKKKELMRRKKEGKWDVVQDNWWEV